MLVMFLQTTKFFVENIAAFLIKAIFSFLFSYCHFSYTFPLFMLFFYLLFYVYFIANQKICSYSIKLINI